MSTIRGTGEAVLFRRGEKVPANAVPLSDAEVVSIQMKRIEKHEPQSDMRAFKYSAYVLSAATGLTGLYIANTMRRNFRLGGLRQSLTYIPTVILSGLCTGATQEVLIKQPILTGKEGCPSCTAAKGALMQVGVGVVYTYILSLLTCIPTARDYYTLPLPGRDGGGSNNNTYLKLLRHVSPKSSHMLGLALFNIAIGGFVASRQLQLFARHLSHPPSSMKEFLSDQQEMLE